MRSIKVVAIVALLAGVAFGQSNVMYQLELGGVNGVTDWENGLNPPFQSGVTDNSTQLNAGEDLTWAVRVTASGDTTRTTQSGTETAEIIGAANLVFDLQLEKSDGLGGWQTVAVGAAPMSCDTNAPGESGALGCAPDDAGFWSSINDGDGDGTRYGGQGEDPWANAAFAISLWFGDHSNPPVPLPDPLRRVMDPVSSTETSGPNMDYGWYPTASGRGGIPITGARAGEPNTSVVVGDGALLGFGVGYKNMNNTYLPGVGMDYTLGGFDGGFGADVPLFEGQLRTGLDWAGTYRLRVIPSADGTNVVHGWVNYSVAPGSEDFGGMGSFAVKADSVTAAPDTGLEFEVIPPEFPPTIVMRGIFYNNSYYDGNKVAIDPGPIAGNNNDDADAIDIGGTDQVKDSQGVITPVTYPAKAALLVGDGQATFKNWSGYNKGLNGLVYQIDYVDPQALPDVSDFTFTAIGKAGTGPNVAVTPTASALWDLGGGSMMLFITFLDANPALTYTQPQAPGVVLNTWLQVDVGTGFGAAAESHWFGNAGGDCGNDTLVNVLVNPSDEIGARLNAHTPLNRAGVFDAYDYTKDSLVSPADQVYARTHSSTPLNCVKKITK